MRLPVTRERNVLKEEKLKLKISSTTDIATVRTFHSVLIIISFLKLVNSIFI